jgi:hypothetical protein
VAERPTPPLTLRWRDITLLVLVAMPVLPWLVRSTLVTGNPFFPLFAGLIPSRDLPPLAAAAFDQHFRYWNWGSSLGDAWTLERRQLLLAAAAGVAVLIGAAAFVVQRSAMARAVAVVLAVTVVAQIAAVGLYLRFWIAIAAVLTLPAVAVFGRYLSGRRIRVVLILMTAMASVMRASSAGIDVRELARADLLTDDRQDYLRRRLPVLPLYEYVNRQLPQSAHILLISSCIGFYLERTTFCGETIQESIRWTTWEECVSDLQRLGVTHVITPQIFATGDAPPTVPRTSLISLHYQQQVAILRRLLGEHARLLTTAADQGLYALDLSIAPPVDH